MKTKSKIPRVLKVELAGDFSCGSTFPKIRIQRKWLAALGFKTADHVMIHATAPGEMLIIY
jgi:hypothetical protein